MRRSLFIPLLFVAAAVAFSQQAGYQTSLPFSADSGALIPETYINYVNGQKYIRTLLKISGYSEYTSGYSLFGYDSLLCDENGRITVRFSSPESAYEGTKSFYEYDGQGRVSMIESQLKVNWKWENSSRIYYRYDESGNVTLKGYEAFRDTAWTELMQTKYSYDSGGRILEILVSTKAEDDLEFKDYSKSAYIYNSHGDLINRSEDFMEDGAWKKTFNSSYTYDANYYLLEYLSQSFWNGSAWSMMSKTIYTRDANGRALTLVYFTNTKNEGVKMTDSLCYKYYPDGKLKEQYETFFSSPDNTYTYESYVYNQDGQVSVYYIETWLGSSTKNKKKYLYSYNDDKSIAGNTLETWNDTLSLWELTNKTDYSYDENGNCIRVEKMEQRDGNWFPSNYYDAIVIPKAEIPDYASLVEMSYTPVNIIANEDGDPLNPAKFSLAQNYPNPFNPVTKISFSLPASGKASLIIYDMLGREVAELINGYMSAGEHEASFSGISLSSGVYIYRLQSGSFTESMKMVLMK